MCFSDLEHVLTRSLRFFRISVMISLRFFDFLMIFDDFGGSDPYFDTVWTRCPIIFASFAMQFYYINNTTSASSCQQKHVWIPKTERERCFWRKTKYKIIWRTFRQDHQSHGENASTPRANLQKSCQKLQKYRKKSQKSWKITKILRKNAKNDEASRQKYETSREISQQWRKSKEITRNREKSRKITKNHKKTVKKSTNLGLRRPWGGGGVAGGDLHAPCVHPTGLSTQKNAILPKSVFSSKKWFCEKKKLRRPVKGKAYYIYW